MLKIATIIKNLSENNAQQLTAQQLKSLQATPQQEVSLSFLNYLSHFCDPNSFFNSDIIENFFRHCLEFTHWQQNKQTLSFEIRKLLEAFQILSPDEIENIQWPTEIQVIEIENSQDLTEVLQVYLNATYKNGEKYRLILDSQYETPQVLAVLLHKDRSLSLRQFSAKMILHHGQLEPLRKDLSLHYDSQLNLKSETEQLIELSPYLYARFQHQEGELTGGLVRGYVNQKYFDLAGHTLTSHQKLFFTIKRLEQYFVQRQSDPFYQEIVTSLERMIEAVTQNNLNSMEECMAVLAQAQAAQENVFVSDKLLSLLIRDLQHTLAVHPAQQRPVVTTARKAQDIWNPSTPKTPHLTLNQQKPNLKNSLSERIQEKKFDLTSSLPIVEWQADEPPTV